MGAITEQQKEENRKKGTAMGITIFGITVLCCLIALIWFVYSGEKSVSAGNNGSFCRLTEYDYPLETYPLRSGTIGVYWGVDEPRITKIKGFATGGMVAIEAKCGNYYRVHGVDFWGWISCNAVDKGC